MLMYYADEFKGTLNAMRIIILLPTACEQRLGAVFHALVGGQA